MSKEIRVTETRDGILVLEDQEIADAEANETSLEALALELIEYVNWESFSLEVTE